MLNITPKFIFLNFLFFLTLFVVLWQRESEEMFQYDLRHGDGTAIPYYVDRFDQMYDFMLDRSIDFSEGVEARKKLRWGYKYLEINTYKYLSKYLDNKRIRYVILVHYSVISYLAFLFCLLTYICLNRSYRDSDCILLFSGFLSAIACALIISGWQDDYTSIEMMALSLMIYCGIRQNFLLALLALLIGVSNRESCVVLGIVYLLLADQIRLKEICIVLLGPILLIGMNFDVIFTFLWAPLELVLYPGSGQTPGVIEPTNASISYLAFFLIINFIIVSPMFFKIRMIFSDLQITKISMIIAIYLLIIWFGSFMSNYFLYILLVPPYILLWARLKAASGFPLKDAG